MRYIPGDEIFTKKAQNYSPTSLTAIDILNFLHVHFKKHSWAFFLLWTYFCLLLPFMNNSTRWRSLSTNLLRFLNEMSEFHSHWRSPSDNLMTCFVILGSIKYPRDDWADIWADNPLGITRQMWLKRYCVFLKEKKMWMI